MPGNSGSGGVRVLIVQNCIPQYRYRMFRHLVRGEGYDVSIVTGSRGPEKVRTVPVEDLREPDFRIAETYSSKLPFGFWIIWQPGAWRLVRRERPDCVVVHGNPYDATSWLILIWGRLWGVPVLAWTIGLQRRESGLKFRVRRLFYRLSRGLLLYGDYPKRLLVEGGMDPIRMHVIYNSLDVSGQREAERSVTESDLVELRQRYGIDDEANCLVFIGRIVPRKRLSILVEAMAKLIAGGYNIHLFLIGAGDDVDHLQALVRNHGIDDRVHFTGAIYDEPEIARHMRLCHAAVVPEAGLPIVHPMSYGVPAIISDNFEQHGTEWEAVDDGVTGFFYQDNNVDDLMAAILRCLEDDAERARLSENCRRRVEERYTSSGHAARIIEGIRILADLEPAEPSVERVYSTKIS